MPALDWPNTPNLILRIGGDAAFQQRAARALDKINQCPAGNTLLTQLRALRINGRGNVGIALPDAQQTSKCAFLDAASSNCRTMLAQAVLDNVGSAMTEIQQALAAIPAAIANPAQWLANAINQTPIYNIQGLPNAAPSNLGVVTADVQGWLNNAAPFPHTAHGANVQNLTLALLVALWPGARTRPGNGGHCRVHWTGSTSIGLTTGVRSTRPKSVGLAHELIHAYYSVSGLQMGIDINHYSTAIFEYMCVGLGPWAAEPISENAVRAGFANVVESTHFKGRLIINYRALIARPCY